MGARAIGSLTVGQLEQKVVQPCDIHYITIVDSVIFCRGFDISRAAHSVYPNFNGFERLVLEERIWRRILSRCLAAPTTTMCFRSCGLRARRARRLPSIWSRLPGPTSARFAWNRARIPISVATAGGLTCALSSGECKRLGLKIWLLDDAHFPTGYANGALEGDDVDPALKKTVLKHRTITVVGPQPSTTIKLGNLMDPTERFVGAAAFDAAGAPLDLALAVEQGDDGTPARLRFDAPTGITTIELYVTSQKTGFRDEYINMVDAASCRVLIDAVYEPTFEHLGDEFGKTILGFFTDEPGFMNEKGTAPDDASTSSFIGRSDLALPWSDELARRLHDALGENWLTKLHGLWTREADGAQVRHAYMDLATQLYRSCFDEQIGDWCRAHGIMHIGHVIEDKSCHTRLGQGAGHYFRAVAGQDMAGVDVVINQLAPGIDRGRYSYFHGAWNMEFFTYALAKLGSSAARLDPKKQGRCMAEVFGAFGWHEGLREMKWIADHMLVRGINWFTPHAFSMAPFPDWDCPPHFYAHGNNPQWPHFGQLMRYMNRTATLLSEGAAARPVAILYHADAEWAGNAMPVERVAAELTRAQIDFDFVPAEAFENEERYEVSIADGTFAVNGCRYQAFVMPGASFIGAVTARAVGRMMAAGVMALAVDEVPGRALRRGWRGRAERSCRDPACRCGGCACTCGAADCCDRYAAALATRASLRACRRDLRHVGQRAPT